MNEYLLIHVINLGEYNYKQFVQFQFVRMNKIQSIFFPNFPDFPEMQYYFPIIVFRL